MDSKNRKNFVSYVNVEELEMQPLGSSRRNSLCENSIKLLPGELPVVLPQSAILFSPVSDFKHGISGVLSVTNFKLSFVTSEDNGGNDEICHRPNHLYGYMDTCLSNIDEIYLLTGEKRRKLIPGSNVPSKVKGIFIVCKNLRTWLFSFKFSPLGHGKDILMALLQYTFPTNHQRLFAYDYKEAYYSSIDKGVHLFRDISDWQQELDRTLGNNSGKIKKGWRLSSVNNRFSLSHSLSKYIIVPESVTDSQLKSAAKHFQDGRPPIWCWSNERGAALVKMSELSNDITERTQENIMLENIRKSHPNRVQPVLIELNKDIGVKSIASGYSKFVSLCTPENIRQFWMQDNNFYSLLENTKWLKYVSYCLQKAEEARELLDIGTSIILQEGGGRDLCCVVSSLVQLLLDPYFRTITGFQSLLQKEWVAAGHPFCDRLGHVVNSIAEKSPLLLLYLDCVWQLCQQFPAEFEFTETYLTTLWDTAHIPIFDTFIFNCERDREIAASDPDSPLILRSVWDWREQFNDADILLFYNPLYSSNCLQRKKPTIKVSHAIPSLELWTQCYFRWIPTLEIRNGGQNHIELYTRLIQSDINQLKIHINGTTNHCSSPTVDKNAATCLMQMNIDSFYPFSGNAKSANSMSTPIMNTSILVTESLLDAQSFLTASD